MASSARGVLPMAQYISNFNPLSVAGCILWVDASDEGGYTADGSNVVSSIKDKSGTNNLGNANKNDFKVTKTQVPFVGKNVFVITAADRIPNSDAFLANLSGTTLNAQSLPLTIYAVYSVLTVINPGTRGCGLFSSTNGYNAFRNADGAMQLGTKMYSGVLGSTTVFADMFIIRGLSTVNTSNTIVKGLDGPVYTSTSSLQSSTLGTDFWIGTNQGTNRWCGCIAEILIYKGELSSTERLKIDGYLAAKWDAPLPVTHPYYRSTFTQTPPPFLRPFNPVEVSTRMMFWFDASDASTVTLSEATKWLDKSGNGNNITTWTGSAPTYSVVNKALTFPAGTTGATPSLSLTSGTSYSGFAVITWPSLTHNGTGVYLRPITTSTAVSATAGLAFGVNRMWYGSPYTAYTPASIVPLGFSQFLYNFPKITFNANNAIPFARAYALAPATPGISELSKEVVGGNIPPANSISTIGQVAQNTTTGLVVPGPPNATEFYLSTVNVSPALATGSNLVFTRNLPYFTDIDPIASTTIHTISNISQGGTAINTFAWAPYQVSAGSGDNVINPSAGTKLVVYWERTTEITAGSSVNGNYVSVTTPSRTASNSSMIYNIGNPVSSNSAAGQLISGSPYDLHEVIMFNGPLSTLDRQKMEAHLIWKWDAQRDDVTGVKTFPSAHPYYNYIPDTVTPYNPAAKLNGTNHTLALWFDGAEPASIVQSGTLLTRWKNKAQSFRNIQKDQLAVPSTGINVPYSLNSKNGLPVLDLATKGSGYMISEISTNTCFTTITNQLSAFVVMSQVTPPTSTTANIYDIFSTSPTAGNFRMFFNSSGQFNTQLNSVSPTSANLPTFGINAFNIYGVTYAGSTLTPWINGVAGPTASVAPGTALTASQRFRLFFGSGLDGKLCEVLVFNESLNTADRQRVEGYLATKWDLQSLLPTGHPYYKVKI